MRAGRRPVSYPGMLWDSLRLHRSQRFERERLQALQEAKLRRLVRHASQHSAYWRGVMEAAGIRPEDVRTLTDLRRLPITTRADLQAQPPAAITSAAFAAADLEQSMTSGSSGRPLTIYRDRGFQRLRKSLFLRALLAGGYRPGDRILLLVHEWGRKAPVWVGWRHVDANRPADELLGIIREFRPTVLYGARTPLRQLAQHVRAGRVDFPRMRVIFTTAETADDVSTALLEEQLGGQVFDIYGTTELGTLGFQCRARAGYHLSEDTLVLELLPIEPGSATCRVIGTNLDLLGTPLIRYDTGDLASTPILEPCSCGRRLSRFERFEGRAIDGITLPGGRLLSPYAITQAVETIPGMERYQVIQDSLERYRLRVQGRFADPEAARAEIVTAVKGVVGAAAAVEVAFEDRVEPPPGRKFRVVESRVTAAGGSAQASP